jgi:DNA-directed RNA polymerase specialized sigma subunit
MRIPRRASNQRRAVRAARQQLAAEGNSAPSTQQIASRTDLTADQVEAAAVEWRRDEHGPDWYGMVEARDDVDVEALRHALAALEPGDQALVAQIYGLAGEPIPVAAIARTMGVSPRRVATRAERACSRLREIMTRSGRALA